MRYNNITCFVTVLVIIITIGMVSPTLADNFFKQSTHVDAFEVMGQKSPEKNDTSIVWLTEGKACSQTGDEMSVIIDVEKGMMYMVDHEKKQYSVIPMDLSGEGKKEDSPQNDEMAKMMQAMGGSMEITVTPTDETGKIGDWNTTKYNVNIKIAMMPSKQEIWATDDIKIDYSMFNAVSSGMMAQMPGFEKIIEEMKQIKGIPVKTVTRTSAMGGEIVTTVKLIEFAEKDAPDGVFDIPDDYKKVEMNMGMGGH